MQNLFKVPKNSNMKLPVIASIEGFNDFDMFPLCLTLTECGTELMRFLMDQEGMTTKDRLFIRVVNHLAEREMNMKVKGQ